MEELAVTSMTFAEIFQRILSDYGPVVWVVVFGYAVVINYATFLSFKYDKANAISGHWRFSEAALLGCAFWGGSLGAKIAQRRFRHKTRKEPFRTTLNLICGLHVVAVLAGLWWWLA